MYVDIYLMMPDNFVHVNAFVSLITRNPFSSKKGSKSKHLYQQCVCCRSCQFRLSTSSMEAAMLEMPWPCRSHLL